MSDRLPETAPSAVKFCWWCGNKLWGRTSIQKVVEGHLRTLHKACAEDPDQVVRDDELTGTGDLDP